MSEHTPRKKPRQNRSRFTVEQILEAAARVFAERGYAGGTTNHIAERAGVSIGSLYQYFPNKDSILVALQEQHMRAGADLIETMLSSAFERRWELEELLHHIIAGALAFHTAAPRLHHVLLFEAPRPLEVIALLHEIEDTVAQTVERLLTERLQVEVRHAGHAAYLIVHVVNTLAHEYVLHPPRDMDEETFVSEVVTMLQGYLLAPCAAGS